MTKKKKLIMKICIGIVILIIGLCIIDRLTTFKVGYGPTNVEEKDGFIEMRISLASSVALVHHYDLIEIDTGIDEIQIYGSVTYGDYPGEIYKIDNRDGHIKELRSITGEVIYSKKQKKKKKKIRILLFYSDKSSQNLLNK